VLSRLRLPLSFDADALRADVEGLADDEWVLHFNTRGYAGDWSGVALRSVGGDAARLYPDLTKPGGYADTEVLARCPALAEAVGRFACELKDVRLLRLAPGAVIHEHRDHELGFEDGEIRVHVPVTTAPGVEFVHDGERVDMRPGEAWYLDLNLPHAVTNRADAARVHLVVDCVVNAWVERLLAAGRA
jgi:mannose-6-phosphate isomerase-like protein (cupin superfamily)